MRYCLALDLQPDPALIAEYEAWHRDVWPEIKESIGASGITEMEICMAGQSPFHDHGDDRGFRFSKKAALDAANPVVQRWEELMWKYQVAIPGGNPAEKWRLMDKIFSLTKKH